jgi:hypothetical protein
MPARESSLLTAGRKRLRRADEDEGKRRRKDVGQTLAEKKSKMVRE